MIGEGLAGYVDDAHALMTESGELADSVHEVGLAEPRASVYKQWIVGLSGLLRHRRGASVSKAIIRADDEVVEVVAAVERKGDGLFLGLGSGLGLYRELV